MTHVGWAQRVIVPTYCDHFTFREMVGTIKRCAHPTLIAHLFMSSCVKGFDVLPQLDKIQQTLQFFTHFPAVTAMRAGRLPDRERSP